MARETCRLGAHSATSFMMSKGHLGYLQATTPIRWLEAGQNPFLQFRGGGADDTFTNRDQKKRWWLRKAAVEKRSPFKIACPRAITLTRLGLAAASCS